MSDICERVVVHCPNQEASDYLAAFVADHRKGDGTVRMALRQPVSRHFERRARAGGPIVATLCPLKSIADLYPTYSVSWLPNGDGPSPEFVGALGVVKGAWDDCFGLVLCGHSAPLGTIDTLHAAAGGRRVARVSAHDVLRAIATYVENARAHNEAALAGHGPLSYISVRNSQRHADAGLDCRARPRRKRAKLDAAFSCQRSGARIAPLGF